MNRFTEDRQPDKSLTQLNHAIISAIELLQAYLAQQSLTPHLHFELEGCVKSQLVHSIDYQRINALLKQNGIAGKLIPEYWQHQWEFVSDFAGQSPLQEAINLTKLMHILPSLFKQQGIEQTLIKPVVWSGDAAQLITGSRHIFKSLDRQIHIPNAIQINISVSDTQGVNLMAEGDLGEHIQYCLLEHSLACCLLFLPEEEAFARLALKSDYGLHNELSSPTDISGGHQGSIALYRQRGKHNQLLGQEPLIVNHLNEVLVSSDNWQKTARVEHRLGASSIHYNAFVNVLFVLLCVVEGVMLHRSANLGNELYQHRAIALPKSLHDDNNNIGAIGLFMQDCWFSQTINTIAQQMTSNMAKHQHGLGDQIKAAILAQYLGPRALINPN